MQNTQHYTQKQVQLQLQVDQKGVDLSLQVLLQRNITKYLDININYQGRKSETSPTIHTGSVQLRAYF